MKDLNQHRLLGFGAIALAASLGGQVQAETANISGDKQKKLNRSIEEVLVTARRREESLMDIPIAVTAITAEQLEAKQIYAVKDVAAYSPGLTINSDSVGRAFVSIRGVGATLIESVQPGVGIFIDGVYQPNTSYLHSPLLDIEQVEVLRGPQGTLFGNNTLGGAINIKTRQPSNEFEGRVSGVYGGSDDFESAAISVSGALIPDVLQARIGASYHQHDGFMKNTVAGGDGNPLMQQSINGTFRLQASDTALLKLNLKYDQLEGASTPYKNVAGPKDFQYSADSNLNNITVLTYKSADLTGEFDVESLATTITATAAYYRRDSDAVADGDYGPIDFSRAALNGQMNTITGEIRFDTEFSDRLSTLVGLFANHYELDNNLVATVVPLDLTVPSASYTENKTIGVFATMFYKLSETSELSVGLRYDDQSLDTSTATTAETYEASELQPRVTLTKYWSPELMSYASLARGFRGGGQNGPGAPNLIYEGDTVWTYEVGAKSQLFGDRLSLNVAAFYNDYSDYIGQNALAPNNDLPGTFVSVNLNSGDVESYGLETEAHLQITDRWSLDGTLTLLHARITDASQFAETTGYALASDRVLFVPDWDFSLNSNYTVPMGEGALTFSAGAVGKGSRQGSSLSETFSPTMDAYYLVDAAITYQQGPLEISLFGKNILDEEYFESYLDKSLLERAGVPEFLVANLGIVGDKRRVGLRASYKF